MIRPSPPLVSFVVAAYDAATTLGATVESVLRQTVAELELVVVDDASTDGTHELLSAVDDPRLVVVRNAQRSGLAASLNRGLEVARGRYVARLDADDLALPRRLERQLRQVRKGRSLAILGSAVLELDADGRLLGVHEPPQGAASVRWHALFGSPFFHPTVLLDRAVLERHGFRYDATFGESEDYDLWTRLLAVADGDNLRAPLVIRRVHPGQASKRRSGLQRDLQRTVALRELARVAPGLSPAEAELAWRAGSGLGVDPDEAVGAAEALERLFSAFSDTFQGDLGGARQALARALARLAEGARGGDRATIAGRALRADPLFPAQVAAARARRRGAARESRKEARELLAGLGMAQDEPVRVVVVSPEPTPYRSPLFDLISERPEVELTALYAAQTVAGREWDVEPRHRAVFLPGLRLPGARRVLRHDYPLTPTVFRALREHNPDVVVVNGWSTFPAQAAIAWARTHDVPYLLLVSSHDAADRPRWRELARRPFVPPVVRGAWGAFALGTLSRESLLANGVRPDRIRLFANTIDVEAYADACDRLAAKRQELRESFGAAAGDVVVLSVGRLVREKGFATLLRAAATAEDPRLLLVVTGSGPQAAELTDLARTLDIRLRLPGHLPPSRLLEAYAAADAFALLSDWEPWGVVVNEAAACGLPLVLSEHVGAAADLLVDGVNGFLVPPGDIRAAADALRRLATDERLREQAGARSRELIRDWGYEPSVESFVDTVREAAGR